jgi:hypothetical protein
MPSVILEARRRAKEYWAVDGLPRIISGLVSLIFGALMLIGRYDGWNILAWMGIFAGWLFLLLGGERDIVEWLKTRTTYRRSGYVDSTGETRPFDSDAVSQMQETSPRGLTKRPFSLRRTVVGVLFLMLLGAFVTSWGVTLVVGTPWICLTAGGLTGIVIFVTDREHKDSLMWISVIGWVLVGFALAEWRLARHIPIPFFFLAQGILGVLRGTATLLVYINRNPLPQQ